MTRHSNSLTLMGTIRERFPVRVRDRVYRLIGCLRWGFIGTNLIRLKKYKRKVCSRSGSDLATQNTIYVRISSNKYPKYVIVLDIR